MYMQHWDLLLQHSDKNTCNILLIHMKHLKHMCITIATCATSRSTFATSIWDICNILLKQISQHALSAKPGRQVAKYYATRSGARWWWRRRMTVGRRLCGPWWAAAPTASDIRSGGNNGGRAGVASRHEVPPRWRRSQRAGAMPTARPLRWRNQKWRQLLWRRRAGGTRWGMPRRPCELRNVAVFFFWRSRKGR
jgi:hypothetical protein